MKRLRCSPLAACLPVLSLLATAGLSLAQTPPCSGTEVSVEGVVFYEAWVDPCHGNDSTATIALPGFPGTIPTAKANAFKTIGAAIGAVNNGNLDAFNPGLVHLNPGVYIVGIAGEPRIVLPQFVNIQGAGARECVLRNFAGALRPVFLPTSDCVCGQTVSRSVILDLSQAASGGANDPYEEMVDGVTFQGGDIQVYSEGEAVVRARISNCIFDMVDHAGLPDLNVPGPEFGVLVVHQYHPGQIDPNLADEGYFDVPLSIFNNTFVQAWTVRAGAAGSFATRTARCDAVAICDVNDPLCGLPPDQSDPDPSLRGIGRLNIQNNLIHAANEVCSSSNEFGSFTIRSFLGVGNDDTSTTSRDTNIFYDQGDNPVQSGNGKYCVQLPNGGVFEPFTVVTTPFEEDPAFLGEFQSRFNITSPGNSPFEFARDWRVLPSSVVKNMGQAPTAAGTLTALNGVVYTEASFAMGSCVNSPLDSFDFDGEGYGSPRVVGGQVDVGYDEIDRVVECAFPNDSVLVSNSTTLTVGCGSALNAVTCLPVTAAGRGKHFLIFESNGSLNVRFKLTQPTCSPLTRYSSFPGTIVPGTAGPGGGTWWIPSSSPSVNTTPIQLPGGYKPYLGTVNHPVWFRDLAGSSAGNYVAVQGLWTVGATTVLTSLMKSQD